MLTKKKSARIGAAWLVAAAGLTAGTAAAPRAQADAQPSSSGRITQGQALAMVRRDFSIPAYFQLSQESYNSSVNGPANYAFFFTYNDPAGQSENINATVDASNGLVMNYYRSSPYGGFQFPPKESEAQARGVAISAARSLYPSEYPQTRIQPVEESQGSLIQPIAYTFNFERYVGGIPAPFDGMSITVDQNGHIQSLSASWTANQSFPSPSGILSPATAAADYARNLGLHLGYSNVWQAVTSQVYLSYEQSRGNYPMYWNNAFANQGTIGLPVLDAKTGRPIDAQGRPVPVSAYVTPKPLVPGGPAIYPLSSKANWTRGQALSYAEKTAGITPAYHLAGASETQTQPTGDQVWTFNWNGPGNLRVNATVDATDGFLSSYNAYRLFSPGASPDIQKFGAGNPTITQSQADAAARAFLLRAFPKDTGGIALNADNPGPYPVVSKVKTFYSIQPMVNGLPLSGGSGNLSINGQTGKVQNFWWQPLPLSGGLPAPNRAVPIAVAVHNWISARPLQLEYLQTQPQFPGKFPLAEASGSARPSVVLAYAPQSGQLSDVLDAVTGQFIALSSGSMTPYAGPIRGLAGVPEAPQITLLLRRGLLQAGPNGTVQPEQDMTRGAFVKLLVDSLGVGPGGPVTPADLHSLSDVPQASPAFSEIRTAYANGWLQGGQSFHPNRPITRSQAAELLVRALGYGQLLQTPQLFRMDASDASSMSGGEYAAAAISSGIGLLPLQNGRFNPQGTVTLARGAAAVVQAAVALQAGRPLYYSGMGFGGAG